jgi:hypothetical protein
MECLDHLSASIAPDPNKKLFVSRGQSPTRRLPREAAIARRLMASGFTCLAPGSASLAAQIAAFKGANRTVGVIGATLANLAFSPPGAEAIMLSPATMPDTFFWFICGLRGIRLIDLRYPTTPSLFGNPRWDGPFDITQEDENKIVHVATAPENVSVQCSLNINSLFDPDYYLSAYRDAIPAAADPLDHFFTAGWRQGFDPSPNFSTNFYLETYPDVAASGANPLTHYIAHGFAEGRRPTP